MRRHFEEMRIRLDQDLSRLIQDLEMSKNQRIKELKKLNAELQAAAVKLEGQSQQLHQLSVHGTAVDIIEECETPMQLDLLNPIPEPVDFIPPHFVKSAMLRQPNNLVGQLMTDHQRGNVRFYSGLFGTRSQAVARIADRTALTADYL